MSKKDQAVEIVVVNAAVAEKTYTDVGAIDALKNKDLAKHVRAYDKAHKGTEKNLWSINRTIALIMGKEEFKEDFGTDKEFARFMGISKAALSKMKRVGEITVGTANLEQLGYRVAQAEELLPLVKGDHIEDFFETMKPTPDMNRDELRELVTEYRVRLEKEERKELEESGDAVSEGNEGESGGNDSLENYDNTDNEEFIYMVPTMTSDGAIDVTLKCIGFDAMELIAKAVAAVVAAHENKFEVTANEE